METLYTMFTLYWIASRADTKSFPAYSMNSNGTELEQAVRTCRSEHRARAVREDEVLYWSIEHPSLTFCSLWSWFTRGIFRDVSFLFTPMSQPVLAFIQRFFSANFETALH